MRKFSLSLLAISFFMLVFSGCSVENHAQPQIYFESKAILHNSDNSFEAKITSSQGQNITVSVITPESVKGITYTLSNSTLYINSGGLRCITVSDYLPSYSALDVLFQSLSLMETHELVYSRNNEESDIYTLKAPPKEYSVYVDRKSGFIREIRPMYNDTYITFEY